MPLVPSLREVPTVSTVADWDVHPLWCEDVAACASSKADISTMYGLVAIELNELLTLNLFVFKSAWSKRGSVCW